MNDKPYVLCLDDEVSILNSLNRELHKDFNVFTANSYKDAISILKNNKDRISVVVSDICMPDVYGLTFLKEVKEICNNIICIILSGQGMFSDAVTAINEKLVYKFILKPWMPNQVLNTVKDACKIKEQNEAMNEFADFISKTTLDFHHLKNEVQRYNENDLKAIYEKLTKFKRMADIGMATTKIIHDFNNKLLILDIGMGYMKNQHGASSCCNFMDSFEVTLAELHNMIDDLQSFLIGKAVKLHLVEVNLNNFLNLCFEDAKFFFNKNVQFEYLVSENIQISLDRDKIKRVILNLAKNSSEAMEEGVFSIKGYEDNDSVYIQISDTGAGMKTESVERIFNQQISMKPNGIGVGLINVKDIIEQHGANIKVKSEPNKGTIFIIEFKKRKNI